MVKGINVFRDYFRDYTDQYVLIGGSACDIFLGENDVDFRVTKDLDISNIKKHRNDILKLVSELVLKPCDLPEEIKSDMMEFHNKLSVTNDELKNLKIYGNDERSIKNAIKEIYRL